jgi:hypothetical protein
MIIGSTKCVITGLDIFVDSDRCCMPVNILDQPQLIKPLAAHGYSNNYKQQISASPPTLKNLQHALKA